MDIYIYILQAGEPWVCYKQDNRGYIYYTQESRGYTISRTTVDIYVLQVGEPWVYSMKNNRRYTTSRTAVETMHAGQLNSE